MTFESWVDFELQEIEIYRLLLETTRPNRHVRVLSRLAWPSYPSQMLCGIWLVHLPPNVVAKACSG